MGAACTKSKGTAAPAARPSTTDRATEAAAAAAEHSQKAQEAAEEAIACAAKATEEAAGLTGQAPEEETQPKEVEEQQAVATPEQTQTHAEEIENKVLPVKEEDAFNISAFGFVAVTPPPPPYKAGANITPKRFGEIATGAGGAYLQLSRRGGDAAFDEAEVVRWLAADGLEIKKGEGITMGAAGSYERRSDKKGGNAAAESAAPT
ncbi:Immune mapped protein 1, related [Eimeria praecox]|uniref:Immune mapped protein 1, related n=1 Tax=Eimeria praecox TaxID=51316 RepID=U6GBP2_9EIME|nr:Immune mapped protein 1, related [Eimeria praecox]